MTHPTHNAIIKLLDSNRYTTQEVSDALGFNPRTLTRRKKNGDWLLTEIIALEKLFEVQLLSPVDKIVYQDRNRDNEINEPHVFYGKKNYKISIIIDPDGFKAQDLDALNADLTKVMTHDFFSKNVR